MCRDVLELNRHADLHLRRFLLGRNRHPQSRRNQQRQNFQPEIVEHPAPHEILHSGRSASSSATLSAPISARRRSGDSSPASPLSTSALCATTVGKVTGDMY